MNKSLLIRSIFIGAIGFLVMGAVVMPRTINADLKNSTGASSPATLVKDGHLTICKFDKSQYVVVKTIKMVVTAYSSTPDQTDDTPFITASGKTVAPGIIANNGYPFGTKFKIPALFGDEIFTVEDRMHPRKGTKHVDVWFAEYQQAKDFGAKYNIKIEVLES